MTPTTPSAAIAEEIIRTHDVRRYERRHTIQATAQSLAKLIDSRVAPLVEALKEVEWSRPKQDHLRECPCCHKTVYLSDPKTHHDGCKLAAALATVSQEESGEMPPTKSDVCLKCGHTFGEHMYHPHYCPTSNGGWYNNQVFTPSSVQPAPSADDGTPERKHLVPTAGYWYRGCREHQRAGRSAEAVMCMENAYNHVENALSAALAERDALNKGCLEYEAQLDQLRIELAKVKGERDGWKQAYKERMERSAEDTHPLP